MESDNQTAEGYVTRTCWFCRATTGAEHDACYRCGLWESKRPATSPTKPESETAIGRISRQISEHRKMGRKDDYDALFRLGDVFRLLAEFKRLRRVVIEAAEDIRNAE